MSTNPRNDRQHSLDYAIIRVLDRMNGRCLRERVLRVEAARMVDPEPRVSEMDDSIRYLEERRLIIRIPTELGDSVSLTPDGVHWYHIHR